jgi:hypothetical protein
VHWQNSNGLTNQKNYDLFLDASGNTNTLHFRMLDDANGNPTDFMAITRNGVDSGACAFGIVVNPYAPCRITMTTIGAAGSNNQFSFGLNVFDMKLNINDDAAFTSENLNTGSQSYWWSTFRGGSNAAGQFYHMELVPAALTGSPGVAPICTATKPYTCLIYNRHLIQQITASASGAGVVYQDVAISGSAVTQTLGGHIAHSGSTPVVSACGTGPSLDANGTDTTGTVTVGTVAAASCTVTFGTAYATWNHCRVTSQSTIASFAYSYTLAALTVTGTSLVGDKFDYDCDGS